MCSKEGEDAILTWVKSFSFGNEVTSLEQLANGKVMALILNRVDPDYFSNTEFVSRLTETSCANVEICNLNANKLIEKVAEYYRECLQLQLNNFNFPDASQISRGETDHICILLQLILGAAVNCDHKNDFISNLMQLDEIDQAELMNFIQIILDSSMTASHEIHDEDTLKQRNHELEKELALAAEENQALRSDLERTRDFIERETKSDPHEDDLNEQRIQELQRKFEDVQEELISMEHSHEDERIHFAVLGRELEDWRQRAEIAEQKADEVAMLQDEVDYLREKADQATRLQAAVDSFKKKAEIMNGLKLQVRELEEQNERERILKEDEMRKSKSYKNQSVALKQQLVEVQARQFEVERRMDRLTDDLRLANERTKVAEAASEELQAQLLSLKDLNDELSVSGEKKSFHGESLAMESGDGNLEFLPPQIREQIIRAGAENKRLREQLEREIQHHHDTKVELNQTINSLITEKNELNERIAKLEQFASENNGEMNSEEVEELEKRLNKLREDEKSIKDELGKVQQALADEKQKSEESVALVKQKEEDIKAMETRYRSYLEKARSVIKTLDPKHNNNTEVVALRSQITEKDRLIKRLENESREKCKSREQEEKLLVSAWYQLGTRNSRVSVEDRVGRSQPGQSFLARQRQQTQQRRNQSSGMNSELKNDRLNEFTARLDSRAQKFYRNLQQRK